MASRAGIQLRQAGRPGDSLFCWAIAVHCRVLRRARGRATTHPPSRSATHPPEGPQVDLMVHPPTQPPKPNRQLTHHPPTCRSSKLLEARQKEGTKAVRNWRYGDASPASYSSRCRRCSMICDGEVVVGGQGGAGRGGVGGWVAQQQASGHSPQMVPPLPATHTQPTTLPPLHTRPPLPACAPAAAGRAGRRQSAARGAAGRQRYPEGTARWPTPQRPPAVPPPLRRCPPVPSTGQSEGRCQQGGASCPAPASRGRADDPPRLQSSVLGWVEGGVGRVREGGEGRTWGVLLPVTHTAATPNYVSPTTCPA